MGRPLHPAAELTPERTGHTEVDEREQLCNWSQVRESEKMCNWSAVGPINASSLLPSAECESKQETNPAAELPADNGNDTPSAWQKFLSEDGKGVWWWCSLDDDWFTEAEPGAWIKYQDPTSKRNYWWKSEETWFWVL